MEEVVAKENAELQQDLEQAFSMLFRLQGEALEEAVQQVSLFGCLALKAGKENEAGRCFAKLLEIDLAKITAEKYLAAVKNMLVMAARMRKEEVFTHWLETAKNKIVILLQQESAPNTAFILSLTFSVCDRKFFSALEVLRQIVTAYLKACNDKQVLQQFFSDWTSLIAQFARRKWQKVNKFLLRVLLKELLRRNDLQLTQLVLLQLNMHLQMYSRWDSFANAFTVYEELQYFYLLLLKRAGTTKLAEAERTKYFVLVLRSIRDWVANVARANMQDDLNILREWRELLKQNLSAGVQTWVDVLVQLEINYWHLTKPKTSRKQLEYLKDLLEPDVVPQEYRKILRGLY